LIHLIANSSYLNYFYVSKSKNIITKYQLPNIVAEIGCNHKGKMEIAKELVLLAHKAGANYAKFQKRNAKELLTEEQYNRPHGVPYNAYGDTYGKHREFLEFDIDQHYELKTYCEEVGIGYACSAWDITSAKELISINPDYIKVPSACNTHLDLLQVLRDEYNGDIHMSLGMTSKNEEYILMKFLTSIGKDRVVLYSCTSGYPVEFKDVCLLEINRLKQEYGQQIKSVAFSGHHLGIAIDVAAYTLGAIWIERHFTKDRTWKGTDHAASLEPSGLSKLVRNLNATYRSLSFKSSEILEIEKPQYEKLKWRNKSK